MHAGHENEALLPATDATAGGATARSPSMATFQRLLSAAAQHEVPVLLLGETGTGKTTYARALHALSRRASGPFVRVDCPGGGAEMCEQAREAREGTFFLDDVSELSPSAQASALRIVEEAGRPSARADLRVVASTRHDLFARVRDRTFRSDLYYRLSVLELRVPPLRERSEDIIPLAHAFVALGARAANRSPPALSARLERALVDYAWPGNVAELRAVMERLLILTPGESLDANALPERMTT